VRLRRPARATAAAAAVRVRGGGDGANALRSDFIVSMSAPALPDDALESGSVLEGRYRIEGVIGGGGMARVYRAEHLGISRPVAIKVLHAGHSQNRDAVARFKREATTSGRLVHPNIVTVTDFGVLADDRCFLVMEALEGETLADRLDREDRLPWRTAVTFLEELLLGLRYAHGRGVVHRDIKPENLFLLNGEERPLLKILDFGIAKLQEGMPDGTRITRSGLTIGTPIYMSPEQTVDGEITPASDLYSSTVVLVEMLTGDPPFYFDDPIAIMKAHLHKTPPTLRELAPDLDIPEALEEIVRRGLAKSVEDRIPSADSYLRMLDRLWDAESLQLRGLRRAITPPAGHQVALPPEDAAVARRDPTPLPGRSDPTPLHPRHDPTRPSARRDATQLPAVGSVPAPAPAPAPGASERDTVIDTAVQGRARQRRRRLLAVGALLLGGGVILGTHRALRSPPAGAPGTPTPAVTAGAGAAAPAPPAASTAPPAASAAAPAASAAPPAASAAPPPARAPSAADAGQPVAPSAGSAQVAGAARLPATDAPKPRDPEQVKRWVAEGNAALAAGRFAAASAPFQRALAADPAAHAAHAGLSEIAYNQGDFQRAVQMARRAVALAPRVAGYRMTLAKAYYKLSRYDDAIAQWQKVLELEPANERATKNIELARAKKGG
jgi:serine/threonine protein kinase/Tfp pilus assembly protein PilF